MTGDATWADYVTTLAAAGAVAAAVGVPLTAYARRPRLSIIEDRERIHTRLEAGAAKVPWIRLLVRNRGWRRAAHGTRVLVESYRENSEGSVPVTMGSPELGWPSTEVPVGGGTIVFAGGSRPLDFAALQVVTTDGQKQVSSMLASEQVIASGGHWELRLTLAMHAKDVFITDLREFLPPVETGYVVRLLVGADDGAARTYDVHVNWNGTAPTAEDALDSVQIGVLEP